MKVLITGATGFIGNHVTRLCLEQGDDVRVMVMPGEDRSPLDGMDVEFVEGNLLDPASLRSVVEGVEGVYHLAAMYKVWTKDPTLHFKVNVDGAYHMMRACMDAKVERVVFTSSIAAIGVRDDGGLANESTLFNQWQYGNEYVMSKYISEQMVRGLIAEGLPAVIVNPGFPFGPGDRMPTPTGKLIIGIIKGEMKQSLDGGFCAVDVRDVAAGHVLAMAKGRIGQGYLLANKEGNMEFQKLAQLIGRIAGVENVATQKVPKWVVATAGRVMETWANLTGKEPQTTYKTSMYSMQNIWIDPSKAVEELGMPQTPIETAIEDAIAWFREHDYDKK